MNHLTLNRPSPGLANLGVYDPPWLHAANDALWAAIRARLAARGRRDVPAGLERARALRAIWHDPALLVGQTCGYPLMTELGEAVTVIGAPVYGLPGCEGARHCSFIVVREDAPFERLEDLRGCRVAMNGPDSNTGMNLLRHAIAPLAREGRFFGAVLTSGGHLLSLESVQGGATDVAAIDCVTFGLAARHRPDLVAGLRVLARTAAGPTLPFITCGGARPEEAEELRQAINEALARAQDDPLLAGLALTRVEPADPADYEVLLRYEADAVAMGYPALA
ncbi:ABC-type phosphate/phosphonate transport system substrate-binding protein [Angulomicrobium tetraedrale]|uniref:ABC-type phosphate/phosphonate transport system substrate-binding protein n=1 Tax=Ancylobacter tetraedralis TaxID=217068 RepID=A0A839Z5N4_9HYPH|nr:PhnD/SsuA/transferrin family substrate-binding protein [Ancylobacter tetraedralis]MBB3769586.1 ABC-type phosphate/phosphonate transport system substrate-binding protein [Ancylobacter tetraedralis]